MTVIQLPEGLLKSLNVLPKQTKIVGLIRHAERYDIPADDFGNDVALMSVGIASSQLLADKLCERLVKLSSSPIKRCLQTAEILLTKAKCSAIQKNKLLGDPGIFITDRHQAHTYFMEQKSIPDLVMHLLSEQPNPSGFCVSTIKTTLKLIHILLTEITKAGISINITHDSILSVVIGVIFNELSIEKLWPDYLEGIFFWQQDDFLHCLYRGKHKCLLWNKEQLTLLANV